MSRDGDPQRARLPSRPMLPRWLTTFIGRERELAELRLVLAPGSARLLTLTGPGGVGKTRLAIQLAIETQPSYPDGIWFAPLSLVRDSAAVPSAVARAVGTLQQSASPMESVTELLADARALLILDNFEHVLDAAPIVAQLLADCSELTVVVTSRHPLGLTGEHVIPVPPLSVPGPDSQSPEAVESDAVRLFVERARDNGAQLRLTDVNAGVIAEICRRLDGLPLAIELASPWLRAITPAALLARLDHRLSLLESGPRDAPTRQRTMRSTIEWSHVLLQPTEQALLRRLAVFIGGFPIEAVDIVASMPEEQPGDLATLGTLIDHSLVRPMPLPAHGLPWDPPRYIMLETIREYALELLDAAGEAAEIRQRHAGWCQALADQAALERTGGTSNQAASQLGVERHNVLAALMGLEQGGRINDALELATSLWPLWLERGEVATGRRHLQRLLAHPDATDDPARRARAMVVLGHLEQSQGNLDEAERLADAALPVLRDRGDDAWLGAGLTALGLVAMVRGEADHATMLLEDSRTHFQRAGDLRAGSWALRHLSSVAYRQGNIDLYARRAEEGLAIVGPNGDPLDLARLGASLALATTMRGRLDDAKAQFETALARYRVAQDAWGEADVLQRLGHLAYLRDAPAEARDLLSQSESLLRRIGDPEGLARTLASQGWLLRREGDLPDALDRFTEAVMLSRHYRVRRSLARALIGKGTIEQDRADSHAAASTILEALDEAVAIGDPLMLVSVAERVAQFAGTIAPGAAAQLVGTATAVREARRVPVPASELGEMEILVRSLRQRLGEDAFTAEVTTGAQHSLDDAIETARSVLGRMIAAVASAHLTQPMPSAGATHDLSPREIEVLALLTSGLPDREIAEILQISRRTVATHITHIYDKIGISSRAGAAAWAVRNGLA